MATGTKTKKVETPKRGRKPDPNSKRQKALNEADRIVKTAKAAISAVKVPKALKKEAVVSTKKQTKETKFPIMDIERSKELAVSQMRAYLPELGLQRDAKSKDPDTHYRNEDTGIRVSLRGNHADGTVNSPITAYYLAVTGPNMKIKKYPQLRSGKFSWDNIKPRIEELSKLVFKTKWQETAARLEDKKPKNIQVKMGPALSDKKIRIHFQFNSELSEEAAAALFGTLNSLSA